MGLGLEYVIVNGPTETSFWMGSRWVKQRGKAARYDDHQGETVVAKLRKSGFSRAVLVLANQGI